MSLFQIFVNKVSKYKLALNQARLIATNEY